MLRLNFVLIVIFVGIYSASSAGQSCVLGEVASNNCELPRVIPGSPGQHVVLMDVHDATGFGEASCGFNVGRTVWFSVTPELSGPVTISTCHPGTAFDTVLDVYSGGDNRCEFMMPVACVDDLFDPECANGCAGMGSKVTFQATAGTQYRFLVGAYNDNAAGCPLCLGVIVTVGEACGDPPVALACALATELPGTPGTHEVAVDVQEAAVIPNQPAPFCVVPPIGHVQWFKSTPQVSGPMVFTTCHPATTFDTVVAAYAGDCQGLMAQLDCSDDDPLDTCLNACFSGAGSRVVVNATEGQTYYFQVGSYAENQAGCELCLGASLALLDCDTVAAPTALITSPQDLECGCDSVAIMGTATAPEESFDHYRLDYRPAGGGSWTSIGVFHDPVSAGLLGVWNTSMLGEGWYLVRLAVAGLCADEATDVRIVRVDKSFDSLVLRSPAPAGHLGRHVCPDGTAWDQCFDHYEVNYRPLGGQFQPVDPAHPTYTGSVLNDPLASWNTSLVPDGNYELMLKGSTLCDHVNQVNAQVVVDNTTPVAVITSPVACQCLEESLIPIYGTVADAHLAHWTLQVTGGPFQGWSEIALGAQAVVDNLIGVWDTTGLPPCDYTLRLVASDDAVLDCNGAIHNQSEFLVSMSLGPCMDFDADGDGDVDLVDYQDFEGAFTGP